MNSLMNSQDSKTDSRPLTIHLAVFDVGQGDTIVISCPDTSEAIVVDCIDADQVTSYLEEQNIQHFRGVIITHLHDDHYCAVSSLIENCLDNPNLPKCEKLLFNYPKQASRSERRQLMEDSDGHSSGVDKRASRTALQRLIDLAKLHRIPTAPASLSDYEPSPVSLKGALPQNVLLLHPHHNHLTDQSQLKNWNLNNLSVTLMVRAAGSVAILTGDLEPEGWDAVIESGVDVASDVLKLPHHGAWKRNDPIDFIRKINPSVAIISVGTRGLERYDHPNQNILSALSQIPNIRVLCTQVTERCGALLLSKKENIKRMITENGLRPYLVNKDGCPCAGTSIVELGHSVRVIHPSINIHIDQVIKPNFSNHQCIVAN